MNQKGPLPEHAFILAAVGKLYEYGRELIALDLTVFTGWARQHIRLYLMSSYRVRLSCLTCCNSQVAL